MSNTFTTVVEDWKETLIKQVKREKFLDGLGSSRQLINFFENYFTELRNELLRYSDDKNVITTDRRKGAGELRIEITNSRSSTIQYFQKEKYVFLKLNNEDLDGNLENDETIAVIYPSEANGLIIVELDRDGKFVKKIRPLTVKWLDEKIKESLLSIVV